MCETESLIPAKGLIIELVRRCNGRAAIVTGRPRNDCMKFLKIHGLDHLFPVCICMEDCPPKPSPQPVILACEGNLLSNLF